MEEIIVSALWRTFIKGTSGIFARDGEPILVDERGIVGDRRLAVVNENGDFVAQRQGSVQVPVLGALTIPSRFGAGVAVRTMCQIAARIEGEEFVVTAPDMRTLRLSATGIDGLEEEVKVWRDPPAMAVDQGKESAAWFTEFLSRERKGEYRLMRMSDVSYRPSKVAGGRMGFQDGYPFLMISDQMLGGLNGKLLSKGADAVTANRFRPNIWLSGCTSHAEDHFSRIRIGEIEFEGKTLCDRCSVICTDQHTGVVHSEPNATLATYRRGSELLKDPSYQSSALGIREKKSSVFVGRNFNHILPLGQSGPFVLRVGDRVEVLETD